MNDPKKPMPEPMPEEKVTDPYAPVTGHPEIQQPFPDENDPNYGNPMGGPTDAPDDGA